MCGGTPSAGSAPCVAVTVTSCSGSPSPVDVAAPTVQTPKLSKALTFSLQAAYMPHERSASSKTWPGITDRLATRTRSADLRYGKEGIRTAVRTVNMADL